MRDVWRGRSEPENLRYLADLYWYGLLVVALGIVTGATLYGGTIFLEVLRGGKDELTILPIGGGGIIFNKKEFDTVVEGFAARQQQYEALKETPPAIADPSR